MIVYSHTLTPRLQYILKFLSDYYQHPFKLTANEQAYTASEDYKINYSHQKISNEEIYINPHALLFENEKRKVGVKTFQHKGYTAFFEVSGDLHFDLFAGIFFLLTRYEEYLPHQKDQFGLYAHHNSVAYREGFLQQPLVNIWLEDFRKTLQEKFPGIVLPQQKFCFLPTYDIDIAWAYRNKEFKIHAGNVVRSILKGKWKQARERIRVVKGKITDPYDAYDWMDELHQRYGLHPLYFFLVADEKGKYDKNIDIRNPEFQELIKRIAGTYKIGVHPSWCSGDNKAQLSKEKKWLETLTGSSIYSSRQHYLRFHLPATFQRLIQAGIRDEYSMGYGQVNGFRASVSSPYYWYDLEQEQATSLLIHPFCFMDATAYYEENLSPEQALQALKQFYTSIKSVHGKMVTLWHNNFLGTAKEFDGWPQAYEQFISFLYEQNKESLSA